MKSTPLDQISSSSSSPLPNEKESKRNEGLRQGERDKKDEDHDDEVMTNAAVQASAPVVRHRASPDPTTAAPKSMRMSASRQTRIWRLLGFCLILSSISIQMNFTLFPRLLDTGTPTSTPNTSTTFTSEEGWVSPTLSNQVEMSDPRTVLGTNTSLLMSTSSSSNRNGLRVSLRLGQHVAMESTEALSSASSPQSEDQAKTKDTLQNMTSCLTFNSHEWLSRPRYGNLAHQDLVRAWSPISMSWAMETFRWPDDLISRMILHSHDDLWRQATLGRNLGQELLEQTLCFPQSALLNGTTSFAPLAEPKERSVHERSVRLWANRLIYWALHHHQHRHATREATIRLGRPSTDPNVPTRSSETCQKELDQYRIGPFDYECPKAKYVVILMGGNGLGANMRGGAVVALLLGLATDRIVLFINNANVTNDPIMQQPWSLASCPRADFQCVFMPPSPCSVSLQDLEEAYTLKQPEFREALLRSGRGPAAHENDRVWKFYHQFLPQVVRSVPASRRLAQYAQEMVDRLPSTDSRLPWLQLAIQAIETDDLPRHGYNYAAATLKIQHILAMYALRPHPVVAQQLKSMMQQLIPPSFVSELSIGLPIRASDKCFKESECLTFQQYMEITSFWWSQHLNQTNSSSWSQLATGRPTVVFTTEAQSVVREQHAFVENIAAPLQLPYQFNFLTNSLDITPDTGYWHRQPTTLDADEAMISSLASFKLQMLPGVSLGNCCSNFHTLLNDFLMEGCGAASAQVEVPHEFHCLQEHPDPALRVCCSWHRDCIAAKKAILAQREQK